MGGDAYVMEKRLTVPRYVISTDLEDSVVILNLNTKRYYILNRTAGAIWRGLVEGKTESEIIDLIALEYDATPEHISASVARIFGELERANLIS